MGTGIKIIQNETGVVCLKFKIELYYNAFSREICKGLVLPTVKVGQSWEVKPYTAITAAFLNGFSLNVIEWLQDYKTSQIFRFSQY